MQENIRYIVNGMLLLWIVPLGAVLSSFFIYRRTGRRDFLKFDSVQFIHAFVVAPLMFVWIKSFLYYLLRQELEVQLSYRDLFLVDTVFSVIALYVYAFVVIHSLTKSFELKRYVDPLYDIFSHSEALHLWISHTAIYLGGMFLAVLLSMVNVWIPAQVTTTRYLFFATLGLSFLGGVFAFAGIWLSNFTEKNTFLKIMKVGISLGFITHVVVYYLFAPGLNATYGAYWILFMVFFAMALCALLFERSERASGWFERFHHKRGWKKGNFLLSSSRFRL